MVNKAELSNMQWWLWTTNMVKLLGHKAERCKERSSEYAQGPGTKKQEDYKQEDKICNRETGDHGPKDKIYYRETRKVVELKDKEIQTQPNTSRRRHTVKRSERHEHTREE